MIVNVAMEFRSSLNPVRDQGFRDTCLAHASSLAHEYSRQSIPLSPEYLHFFATGGMSGGATIDGMMRALRKHGQCTEADCPYMSADPPAGWKPPAGLTVFRRATEPKNADVMAIEEAIRAGATPVLGIQLPEPFFDPTPPWIITPTGSVRGLHAVAAVGIGTYSGDKVILVRNSWGRDWGDEGHAWLSTDFLNQHLIEVFILTHEVI